MAPLSNMRWSVNQLAPTHDDPVRSVLSFDDYKNTYAGDPDISIDPTSVLLYKKAKRGSTIFRCKDSIDKLTGVSTSCIAYFKARYVDDEGVNRVDYFPAHVKRFCKCKLVDETNGQWHGKEVLLCCVVWIYTEQFSELGGVVDLRWAKDHKADRVDTIPACLLVAPGHYMRITGTELSDTAVEYEHADDEVDEDQLPPQPVTGTTAKILIQMGNMY